MNRVISIGWCWYLLLPSISIISVLSLSLSTTGAANGNSPAITTTTTPTWLTDRLAAFELRVHDFPDTGRGLQTSRDRLVGDVLIQVPQSEALTVDSMLQRYPLLSFAAEYSLQAYQTQLTDEQVLAIGLLLLRKDQDPYVVSLPAQYSVLQMPDHYLSFLPLAYQKLIRAYRHHVANLRQSLVLYIPDQQVKDMLELDVNGFLWAFATVRSRCVGMDGKDDARIRTGGSEEIRVLLPGFDLLNHKFGAQTAPGYSEASQAYVIKSQNAYSKDDQVFISYSDERDNLKMIMTYGFCIPGNPERVVTFDAQELLQACAVARPQYFAKAVLGQLWSLMEQLGKHQDMYVWDGSTQLPRESLQTGLQMMGELEQQFLTEPDDSFGDDLLAALLSARRQELSKCRTLLVNAMAKPTSSDTDTDESAWLPMMRSIQLLLEEETAYLGDEDCATVDDEASATE